MQSFCMDGPCVFCAIVAGTEPATVIAANDGVVAFLPRPQGWLAPGHVLVIPREHVVDIFDASVEDLAQVAQMSKRVAEALVSELGAGGVNVLNASGPDSEQSVLHLHFHVVPRWKNDGPTTWPEKRSGPSVPEGFADRLALHLTRS